MECRHKFKFDHVGSKVPVSPLSGQWAVGVTDLELREVWVTGMHLRVTEVEIMSAGWRGLWHQINVC